jgi:hypothetical protein
MNGVRTVAIVLFINDWIGLVIDGIAAVAALAAVANALGSRGGGLSRWARRATCWSRRFSRA